MDQSLYRAVSTSIHAPIGRTRDLQMYTHTHTQSPMLTNGADDASVTHNVRMAADGEQTEVLQASVGQLGLHLRNSQINDAWISRVQPPSPAEEEIMHPVNSFCRLGAS